MIAITSSERSRVPVTRWTCYHDHDQIGLSRRLSFQLSLSLVSTFFRFSMPCVLFPPRELGRIRVTVPVLLDLTKDVYVEQLMSDVPFFSVGLLAFGVFTFFLVLRRVTLTSIYLYASALFAFVASIFDLSLILDQISQDLPDIPTTGTLVDAREVGYSLSIGFRFIFFWTFVAQCPRGEVLPRAGTNQGTNFFELQEMGHSGSWGNWGMIGLILKWASLVLTLAIPILQILWRTAFLSESNGPIYLTESTLEIVVSSLFILKLLLNTYISPTWKRTIKYYITPIAVLVLSIGLGVSNAVEYLISETTLGRFLQAVELYVLILFILICEFYPFSSAVRKNRSSSFRGLSLKPPPLTVNVNVDVVQPIEKINPVVQSNSRPPVVRASNLTVASQRFSSWLNLGSRRRSRRVMGGDERLPSQVSSPAEEMTSGGLRSQKEIRNEKIVPPRLISRSPRPTEQPVIEDSEKPDSPVLPRPQTEPSTPPLYPSYYGASNTSPRMTPGSGPSRNESPIYGLTGIISANQRRRSIFPQPSRVRSTTSSFDELLQRQKELDRSIAALNLISPANVSLGSALLEESSNNSASIGSNGTRFSLSVFPEPPEALQSTGSGKLNRPRVSRPRVPREEKSNLAAVPPPIVIPDFDNDTGPLFDTVGPSGRFITFQSAGTQYDVTSFIGNLTGPASTNVSGTNGLLSGIVLGGSTNASNLTGTPGIPLSALGPDSGLPFTQSAGLPPSLGPATASSGLLPNASRDVPGVVAGPSTAVLPLTFRERLQRGQRGPASRPRITIIGPRPLPQDGKGDRALDAVERPRQRPSDLKKVDSIEPF